MGEKEVLVEAMRLLVYLGLTNPKGGNGSIRVDEYRFFITPSGKAKHRLSVEDLVLYDFSNNTYHGNYKPSIEVYAHAKIYEANPEAKAILHAHTPLSLALIDAGLKDWWVDTTIEIEYSVGKVYIAEPAPPGSTELAVNIAKGVKEGAKVIVVPRHGVFAWGKNVDDALDAIIAFESTAKYVVVKKMFEDKKLQ